MGSTFASQFSSAALVPGDDGRFGQRKSNCVRRLRRHRISKSHVDIRWQKLDADRLTGFASSASCRPNDLRFCQSQSSALRRIRRNKLPRRHLALEGTTLQWTQATPAHQPPAVTSPRLFPHPNGRADLLAGSTDNSTSSVCSNGTVPIGCSYFHRLFRFLALQQPLRRIL